MCVFCFNGKIFNMIFDGIISRSLFIVLGKGTLTKSIEIRAYTVQIANRIMIKMCD